MHIIRKIRINVASFQFFVLRPIKKILSKRNIRTIQTIGSKFGNHLRQEENIVSKSGSTMTTSCALQMHPLSTENCTSANVRKCFQSKKMQQPLGTYKRMTKEAARVGNGVLTRVPSRDMQQCSNRKPKI